MGAAGRGGSGPSRRPDDRRAPAVERTGARESRVEAGERDLAQGVRVFCPGGTRPPSDVLVAFIDAHRTVHGVEAICTLLPIALSTYFRHTAQHADPGQRSVRARRDDELRAIIRRLWPQHFPVDGPRKVWRQMGREGLRGARCRVRRLMREMGRAGAVRGRAWVTTTQSETDA